MTVANRPTTLALPHSFSLHRELPCPPYFQSCFLANPTSNFKFPASLSFCTLGFLCFQCLPASFRKKGGGIRVCVATALPWGLGEFHGSHLFIRRSCGVFYVDLLYVERFPGGLSRHIRVRFNAVVASANSAATLLSPRIRNRRIPRCSFNTPMTGSASAFRRRYNARPLVEANLLRMRRRAG